MSTHKGGFVKKTNKGIGIEPCGMAQTKIAHGILCYESSYELRLSLLKCCRGTKI